MFKLVSEPTFKHRIHVQVPVDKGHREESLWATYRVLPVDKASGYDLSDGKDSAQFLRDVLVDLDDIVDEGGEKLSFNAELLEQMIGIPYVRAALAGGYFEAVSKARRGN